MSSQKEICYRARSLIPSRNQKPIWYCCRDVEHAKYPPQVSHRPDVVALCLVSHKAIGESVAAVGRSYDHNVQQRQSKSIGLVKVDNQEYLTCAKTGSDFPGRGLHDKLVRKLQLCIIFCVVQRIVVFVIVFC